MQINDIISMGSAVLAPNLEIIGGGGWVGSSRPLEKWGAGLQKNFFPPFGPQFGLKIRGEPGPPGPSPGSATAV